MTALSKLHATETEILATLRGGDLYDAEAMFWMRYQMGVKYLNEHYPVLVERMKQSKLFWDWYRDIWHMNDLWILKHRSHAHIKRYKLIHKSLFENYEPTPLLIKSALRETEAITT